MTGKNSVKGIAVLGFQENVRAALELFLQRHKQFQLVAAKDAELLIVHGDQGRDPEVLRQYYAHKYSKPGVLISSRSLAWPNFICLAKPYEATELLTALERIGTETVLEKVGAPQASVVPDATVSQRNASRKQAYDDYQSRIAGQKQALQKLAKRNGPPQRIPKPAGTPENLATAGSERGATIAKVAVERISDTLDTENAGPHKSLGGAEGNLVPVVIRGPVPATEATAVNVQAQYGESYPALMVPLEAPSDGLSDGGHSSGVGSRSTVPGSEVVKASGGQAAKVPASEIKVDVTKTRQSKVQSKVVGAVASVEPQAGDAAPTHPTSRRVKKSTRPETPLSIACKAAAAIVDPEELAERQAMISRLCGFMPDLDFEQPDVRKRGFVSRDNTLLECLLEARSAGKASPPLLVSGVPLTLGYLPETDQFIHDVDDDMLLQLATTRFGFGELGLGPRAELAVPHYDGGRLSGLTAEAAAGFLWKVALLTARGRLFSDMDPEKLYQLKPGVAKDPVFVTPHADKIEKLWYGHRLSVLDIAKILKIPQRFAFSFMVGAYTLGWFQE